jgi:hypothetical protein
VILDAGIDTPLMSATDVLKVHGALICDIAALVNPCSNSFAEMYPNILLPPSCSATMGNPPPDPSSYSLPSLRRRDSIVLDSSREMTGASASRMSSGEEDESWMYSTLASR